MWKNQKATKLLTRLFLMFVLTAHLLETARALSDKRLCADANCKDIISLGIGTINYRAGEEGMVSFKINSVIRIKSKGAGNNPKIWGIEVNGREGYAPMEFIRENKILIKEDNLKFVVDVEQKNNVPVLSASEKLVEQGITLEATTTKPLNLTPAEPVESIFNNSSDEKLTAETLPLATPVISTMVDDTKATIIDNEKHMPDKEQSSENYISENEKGTQDKAELDKTPKTVNQNEDKSNIEQSSEISKEGAKVTEFNIDNEIKHTVEKKNTQEKEETFIKIDNIESNTNIIEVYQQQSNTEEDERGTENQKDDPVVKDQKPNVLDDNNKNRTSNDIQVVNDTEEDKKLYKKDNSSNYNNTVVKTEKSEIVTDEQLTTIVNTDNAFSDVEVKSNFTSKIIETVDRISAKEPAIHQTNNESPLPKLDTTVKETNDLPTNKSDTFSNNVNVLKDSVLTESATSSAEKSAKISNNKLQDNKENVNTFTLQDEVVSGNTARSTDKLQENETTIANTYQDEVVSETTAKEINALPTEISDKSSNIENIFKNVVLTESETSSSEKNVQTSNDKLQDNKENVVSVFTLEDQDVSKNTTSSSDKLQGNEPTIVKSYHNEVVSEKKSTTEKNDYLAKPETNKLENKIHLTHVNADENTSNDAPSNNHINTSFNNSKELNKLKSSSIDENSSNSHNQQETNNEDFKVVPLQKSKVNKFDNNNNFPTENLPYNKETLINTDSVTEVKSDRVDKIFTNVVQNTEEAVLSTYYHNLEEVPSQAEFLSEKNIKPTTHNPIDDTSLNTPLQSQNDENIANIEDSAPTKDNEENLYSTDGYNSLPITTSTTDAHPDKVKTDQSEVIPPLPNFESKENKGLFATIMGTVNNMLTNNKKKPSQFDDDNELDRLLYSQTNIDQKNKKILNEENSNMYCKNIGPNGECPEPSENHDHLTSQVHHTSSDPLIVSHFTLGTFLKTLTSKILESSELLAFLIIAAAASLIFVFGYYCFCNSSREGSLLYKLNQLESSLLASHKENSILKHNIISIRQKLASIEDNSFGSNDMVVSLRKDLEQELMEKAGFQEQITTLQKELENAADAGIELNKIVSELLSNQTGDESIISSVEGLQKQLNEQQNTIYEINASLAEKSRENSELQLLIAEQNARYEAELANVQRDNDELDHEKGNLLTRLEEMKTDFDKDITAALEGKNLEIKRLQNEILDISNRLENEHTKWQTSVAKIEALEECLKSVRRDPKVNINEVIDVAYVKAQLIETQNMCKSLEERHKIELDSRKFVENQLEVVTAEVQKYKKDFNQSEKDKLEAQTRLEVLSNYFKDKENQLQRELSLKESMWLKQQGETTTTVDRVTAMQEEIQSLKSQNDSLRAEIEAQVAAHKAQTGTLENRAHETWLAARQSDRRYEEARAEATVLRRKLTALAGGNANETNKSLAGPVAFGDELIRAPSPIHMDSPGSPILERMPLPPFLAPSFMGPPPPFMGMPPPPPFVPPGEMRPAPLGRIMSPPPQRSGRFSPQHLDYEDYLEYDSNNTWHRHTYSPPPRTYRSLSPTDSRYNYETERGLISTYDTETDFSPPPSPRESRRRADKSSERIDSSTKTSYGNTKKLNSSNKGPFSSGSEKSSNTHLNNDAKTKNGSGGKNLV